MLKEATTKLRECAKRGGGVDGGGRAVDWEGRGGLRTRSRHTACISACVNGRNMELAQKGVR